MKSELDAARSRQRRAAVPMWRYVLQALDNERCLDLRYRAINAAAAVDTRIPNYKVMKQLALRNRCGVLYSPLIMTAQVLIPLIAPWQWLCALVLGLGSRARAPRVHAIATAPANLKLIAAALAPDVGYDADLMSMRRLSSGIGVIGVLRCMLAHLRLLAHVVVLPAPLRRDLLLHARDAFTLLLLVRYALDRPQQAFITDDHYQRWAYLLSHCAADFSIVQHGFLDDSIDFAHPFGTLATVYVRDHDFDRFFLRYYQVHAFRIFGGMAAPKENPFSADAVFLASSFPSIDSEIVVLERIRAAGRMPIIVKFHPSHAYDERRQTLAALADYICPESDYPACRIFVSHASFMEYDYRALGIRTFSIARCGDARTTAEEIITAFKATDALEPWNEAAR